MHFAVHVKVLLSSWATQRIFVNLKYNKKLKLWTTKAKWASQTAPA